MSKCKCMFVYVCTYIKRKGRVCSVHEYTWIYICIYRFVYMERERERDREWEYYRMCVCVWVYVNFHKGPCAGGVTAWIHIYMYKYRERVCVCICVYLWVQCCACIARERQASQRIGICFDLFCLLKLCVYHIMFYTHVKHHIKRMQTQTWNKIQQSCFWLESIHVWVWYDILYII